ncbi:uncharacterized protein LOC105845560 isoform X3 [Hydra vulgaris]|uniref:uncharacterized protein LOC105845560 isoform X3 n=1 Tax=Hydra vulgaris TaxID=6087 RepID=UPI001F5EE178|nr:uncharacterized protein LOC105845560 isoform X3 [Hydra vulgaris]
MNDEFVVSFLILTTGVATPFFIRIDDENNNTLWSLSILEVKIPFLIISTENVYEIQITANAWSSIVISNFFKTSISNTNSYNFSIAVNGTVQFSYENFHPMVFTDVILYTFTDCIFLSPCSLGSIKNLSIYSQTQVFWSQWSEWSQCNESFVMTKTRYCNSNQWLNCVGNSSKVKSCSNQVFWAQWSDWSNSSNSYGFMNRTRECIDLSILEWIYANQSELLEYSEFFIMEKTTLLSKGNLITIIERLNKEFSVSFDLNPTSIVNDHFGNVIHLTIENDISTYGDRIPAVFFIPGASRLHICAAINNIPNNCLNQTSDLKLGMWSSLKISQELIKGKYNYSIQLNNEILLNVENQDAREFLNVKVYVSDPWFDASPAYIRNLKIINGNSDINKCTTLNPNCSWSNGVCVNTKGSFLCSCTNGFVLDYNNASCFVFLGWTQWSIWSICNTSYGVGFHNRTRVCNSTSDIDLCLGISSQINECLVKQIYTDTMLLQIEIPMINYINFATLSFLYGEFVVSFEVLFTQKLFGTFLYLYNYQDNIVMLEHNFNNSAMLVILRSFGQVYSQNINIKPFSWNLINVSQHFINTNTYNSTVSVNGAVVFSTNNSRPRVYPSVDVTVCPYSCASGFIRNIYITSKKEASWTSWSNWSNCSASYGYGIQTRSRECNISNAVGLCSGNNIEIIGCYLTNTYTASWTSWSNWSNCSASYGYGIQTRSRECNISNAVVLCSGNNTEIIDCYLNNTYTDVNKTLWKVLNTVTLQGYLLTMNLQIYPTFETSLNANVEFEYVLTPYFSFTAENVVQSFVKTNANRLKYNFNGITNSSESFNFTFTATFNDTQCPKSGVFTFDIPLKMKAQVESGRSTTLYKAFRKVVECFAYPKIPIVASWLVLKENYGRGIYWDVDNLNIYVCMNQHFPSSKVACYISNDEGSSWYELDVRIGSVLGHHMLTKELYAVHRNQKTYMMFHNSYNKWLSITNHQFKNASSYIDSTMRINLEGDYNQIHTLGPNQWLGNAQGLFFRIRGNNTWVLRIKWHF